MKTIPERLSLRLGDLRKPLEAKLAKTHETPSAYIQRIIAADLRRPIPAMQAGRPRIKLSCRKVGYRAKS